MDNEYRRAANITVIAAGITVFFILFIKYALAALIPFLLAAIIAAIVSPAAQYLASKTKISPKIASAVLVILFFASLAAIFAFAAMRLVGELGNLIDRLSSNPEMIADVLDSLVNRVKALGERFGALGKILESDTVKQLGIDLDILLVDALNSLMSSLTATIPAVAMGMIAGIPSFLLFLAVFLISAFYFCIDGESIKHSLASILPDAWQKKLPSLQKRIGRALKGYVKAYLCLMALTFVEMLIGLSALGIEYVFLLAILISVVDILPVLGTGTILIPWSIFAFVTSNTKLGIGLIVLYVISLVVRQIAEPKIVGSSLGIHPLATLASIYLGIRFVGLGGIFLGPVAALILKGLFFKEGSAQSVGVRK